MTFIPINHDPNLRDLLARWQIIRAAVPFGWRDTLHRRPPDSPEYAPLIDALVQAGVNPFALHNYPDHDEAINQLRQFASVWTLKDAAAAYLAGLWSAPAAWRSALPGLLIHRAMPDHPHQAWSQESSVCQVCGEYPNGLSTQLIEEWWWRLTIGAPPHGCVREYAQVLGWLGNERPQPTEYDNWAMGAILAVIRALPPGTRYPAATKVIKSAAIVQGTESSGQILDDLALMGILAPEAHPGMWERFSTYKEREKSPYFKSDAFGPLAWWDSSVGNRGVRTDVFEALFGVFDIPVVDLDAPRPAPSPAPKETLLGGLNGRARAFNPRKRARAG
jgi:hypothetical protein